MHCRQEDERVNIFSAFCKSHINKPDVIVLHCFLIYDEVTSKCRMFVFNIPR